MIFQSLLQKHKIPTKYCIVEAASRRLENKRRDAASTLRCNHIDIEKDKPPIFDLQFVFFYAIIRSHGAKYSIFYFFYKSVGKAKNENLYILIIIDIFGFWRAGC